MAQDWAEDVRRYVADADDEIVAGIVRYCGIALRNRDSSLVSFSDEKETARVRNNFLRKKLGLEHADAELDAAIAAVGERMDTSFRNRVTVYYLLADSFGKLEVFRRKGRPAAPASLSGATVPAISTGSAASAGATGLAGLSGGKSAATGSGDQDVMQRPQSVAAPLAAPAATTPPSHSAAAQVDRPSSRGLRQSGESLAWLWWLVAVLVAVFMIWWLFFRQPDSGDTTGSVATEDVARAPAARVDWG